MILITGISGHIGRRMAQRFSQEGIDFIGIDHMSNPGLPEDRFKKMDIRDPSIAKLIEGNKVRSIIHMAFCMKTKAVSKTRNDIDLNGSKNIIKASVEKGVKHILFTSSIRVYGDQKRGGGVYDIEGNYLNPGDDPYAQNKIKVENIFLKAAEEYGLKVALLRIAIVCRKGGGAGLGDMLKSTSKNGCFFTLGNRNPLMKLVHINDVIDACLNAIGKEGIFNIASEGTLSLMELFSEAARLGGKTPLPIRLPEIPTLFTIRLLWKLGLTPLSPSSLKTLDHDITMDLSKTKSVLGNPTYTIHQTLKDIVEG